MSFANVISFDCARGRAGVITAIEPAATQTITVRCISNLAEKLLPRPSIVNKDRLARRPSVPRHHVPGSGGNANDRSVVPEAMRTCCLPSSMKVIGAAPQIGVPVA